MFSRDEGNKKHNRCVSYANICEFIHVRPTLKWWWHKRWLLLIPRDLRDRNSDKAMSLLSSEWMTTTRRLKATEMRRPSRVKWNDPSKSQGRGWTEGGPTTTIMGIFEENIVFYWRSGATHKTRQHDPTEFLFSLSTIHHPLAKVRHSGGPYNLGKLGDRFALLIIK